MCARIRARHTLVFIGLSCDTYRRGLWIRLDTTVTIKIVVARRTTIDDTREYDTTKQRGEWKTRDARFIVIAVCGIISV